MQTKSRRAAAILAAALVMPFALYAKQKPKTDAGWKLSSADRKKLQAVCGTAMPADDALSDCAKGVMFDSCGRWALDLSRYDVLGNGTTAAIVMPAMKSAGDCQALTSPDVPIAKYAWSAAYAKYGQAKSAWSQIHANKKLPEALPPYEWLADKIPQDRFKPSNAADVAGFKSFCRMEQQKLTKAKYDFTAGEMKPLQRAAFDRAVAFGEKQIARCLAGKWMVVAWANEIGFSVATARRIADASFKQKVKAANDEAKLEILAGKPQHKVVVIMKSFIQEIGPGIGVLPGGMNNAQKIELADMALITDQMFSENPQNPDRDHRYRMFTRKELSFSCHKDAIVGWREPGLVELNQYSDAKAPGHDTGTEPAKGGLQAPPGVVLSEKAQLLPAPADKTAPSVKRWDRAYVGWGIKARPNRFAAFPFHAVKKRPSEWIWQAVSGEVRCKNGKPSVTLKLRGSDFPSHRAWAWIDNDKLKLKVDYQQQHAFSYLWRASHKDPTMVGPDP